MTLRTHMRSLLCAPAIALVAAPAAAQAATYTVDDDKAQCPSAGFTTIQAAINQAASWPRRSWAAQ